MKVLLICVGSRGDAEPFCALAARLIDERHEVVLCLQQDLTSLAPTSTSLQVHTLPFTQLDFYKYAGNPSRGKDHPNPRVKFIGSVVDCVENLVLPCTESILEAAKDCDVIVTSALGRNLAFVVAQKHEIPCALVHYQPFVPNYIFPHYSQHDECLKALADYRNGIKPTSEQQEKHRESMLSLERVQFEFMSEVMPSWYEKFDMQDPWTWEGFEKVLSGHGATVSATSMPPIYIINAYSDELAPGTAEALEAGPHVHYVGALADHYVPSDFEPDAELVSYIAQHCDAKPVCIGFGSMPYAQAPMLLNCLYKLKLPAVLVGKALSLPSDDNSDIPEEEESEWRKGNIYQIDSAPYAWLLPQCRLMVCHGGAGVVQTTLRAGIPCIVSPFFGDQFFFADLLEQLGLGKRMGRQLSQATAQDFEAALLSATSDEAYSKRAVQVGTRLKEQPLGVDRMIDAMNKIVN